MTDTPAIPDFLIDYLEQRRAQRANTVDTVLASLTKRERALVHDTAVMGYVQGMRHPEGEPIGKDRQVIDACLAFPDLYPAISAAAETSTQRRETVKYFVQGQQPDGEWEQASSPTTDPAVVMERFTACCGAHPDQLFRIAQRTTTTVEEYRVPDDEEEQP